MLTIIAGLAFAATNPAAPVEIRRPCEDWGCGTNGPSLTGIAAGPRGCEDWGCGMNGPSPTGFASRPKLCEKWGSGSNSPSATAQAVTHSVRVIAVELPDGRRIDLR